MSTPTTQKIVEQIIKDYRTAGKALAKAEQRRGPLSSWMDRDTFDDDADKLQAAYDAGEFEDIDATRLNELMEKYGAPDIYHLTASYFNNTGKILRVC